MAVAVPFVASMIVGKVVSKAIGDITGSEELGMLAGFAAGAWTGAQAFGALPGATEAAGGEIIAGGEVAGADITGAAPEGLYGGIDYTQNIPAPPGQEGLMSKVGGWVEKHPVATMIGASAVQGMAAQRSAEKEAEAARQAEEARYEREHQAIDPSKVRSLEPINRGLIEGGYVPPGQRVKTSDLPNYQQLLDRYRRR